jgi:hypothetical protein
MKLTQIADTLKARATLRKYTPITIHLTGGLSLTMRRSSVYWALTVSRDDNIPSETEIQVIRRDFAIPDHAYKTQLLRAATSNAVQLTWMVQPPIVYKPRPPGGTK